MYYLYTEDLLGTFLAVVSSDFPPNYFAGIVLASNIDTHKEGALEVFDKRHFSKLDTKCMQTAYNAYEKEKKRVRKKSLINIQFSDK